MGRTADFVCEFQFLSPHGICACISCAGCNGMGLTVYLIKCIVFVAEIIHNDLYLIIYNNNIE